ncbi:hypothetical protein ABID76_004056 [Burkholderia ambifaria]
MRPRHPNHRRARILRRCTITSNRALPADTVLCAHGRRIRQARTGPDATNAISLLHELSPYFAGSDGRDTNMRHRKKPCAMPRAVPTPLRVGNRYGLSCPECNRLSRAETGRYCSLTFHCLPFLARCPVHGCSLYLADRCSARELGMYAFRSAGCLRNSQHLSEICTQLLCSTESHCALDEIQSLLLERRYLTDDGAPRETELVRDINAVLSDGFEDSRLNFWLFQLQLIRRVVRHLQQPQYAHHPTAIAVLLIALAHIEYSRRPCRSQPVRPVALGINTPGTLRCRSGSKERDRTSSGATRNVLHKKRNIDCVAQVNATEKTRTPTATCGKASASGTIKS